MATDNFNRADETPIAAPWTKQGAGGNFNLSSNTMVKASSADDSMYYYSGAASSPDQFSEAKIVTKPTSNDWGPAVRIGGTGVTGYFYDNYINDPQISKHINGVYTEIASLGGGDTTVVGDVERLEVSGTTLKAFINGVQKGSNATDASITSGQPGIFWYENSGAIDDWAGGDLSGGSTPISSSDTGAGTDTATLAAAISASDANGSTESATPQAVVAATDANGSTTEIASVQVSNLDANGVVTETASVKISTSDTNNTPTEAASLTAQIPVADANSTTTESGSVNGTTLVSSSDSNSATVESAAIKISVTDNNAATTENAKLDLTASDTNSPTTEIGTPKAVLAVSDFNNPTVESAAMLFLVSSADSATGSDSAALKALYAVLDGNGTAVELASIFHVGVTTVDQGFGTESWDVFKSGAILPTAVRKLYGARISEPVLGSVIKRG